MRWLLWVNTMIDGGCVVTGVRLSVFFFQMYTKVRMWNTQAHQIHCYELSRLDFVVCLMNNSGFTIVGYTLLVIYWCVRGRGGYFDDGVMIEFCIRSVNDWLMITFDHHITKHNTLFFGSLQEWTNVNYCWGHNWHTWKYRVTRKNKGKGEQDDHR